MKKAVLKNFAKIIRKHLWRSLIFDKVEDLATSILNFKHISYLVLVFLLLTLLQLPTTWLNPFVSNVPFLYPLKTTENRKIFWCFQLVRKGCIENKWVNLTLFGSFFRDPSSSTKLTITLWFLSLGFLTFSW